MKSTNTFPLLLHGFFLQWLGQQRNCSGNTVRSYRAQRQLSCPVDDNYDGR